MYAIDDATAAATMPTPETQEAAGWFTEGTPGTVPATLVRASWLNGIQSELLNILSAAGISPVKTTFTQVLSALKALFGQLGAANSWTSQNSAPFESIAAPLSGATLTLPFSSGNNFVVGAGVNAPNAVNASFILGNPTGVLPGQAGVITFVQDAAGSHTISSRGTLWKGVAGARVNLTPSVASVVDSFPYVVNYDGTITLFAALHIS